MGKEYGRKDGGVSLNHFDWCSYISVHSFMKIGVQVKRELGKMRGLTLLLYILFHLNLIVVEETIVGLALWLWLQLRLQVWFQLWLETV